MEIELKSEEIFPLKERARISSTHRARIIIAYPNSEGSSIDVEMVSMKDYHKVVLALEAAEKQINDLYSQISQNTSQITSQSS